MPRSEYTNEINIDTYIKNLDEENELGWEIADFFSQSESASEILYESSDFYYETTLTLKFLQREGSDVWSLYIASDESYYDGVFLEYEFGFLKNDGSVEHCCAWKSHIRGGDHCIYSWTTFELLKRKNEFTPTGGLTITCSFKEFFPSSFQLRPLHELPAKLMGFETLSENLKNLFLDKDSCDVTLQVKGKNFSAHKTVLVARSPVFAAMFEYDTSELRTGIVKIPDCDPDSFPEFLEYLYCGKLECIPETKAINLYCIADKYEVRELKVFCMKCMKQYVSVDNVCEMMTLAERTNGDELLSSAREIFYKNASTVVKTPEWRSLFENNYELVNKLILDMASRINK